MKYFGFLILCVLLMGCTHVIVLKDLDVSPIEFVQSKDKKVALIFSEEIFPAEHTLGSLTVDYVFRGLSEFMLQAHQTILKDSVKSLESFQVYPGPGYDVYLYPSLSLTSRSERSPGDRRCYAKYSLRMAGANNATLIEKSGTGDFGMSSWVKSSCKMAILLAFNEVTYTVLRTMDAPVK